MINTYLKYIVAKLEFAKCFVVQLELKMKCIKLPPQNSILKKWKVNGTQNAISCHRIKVLDHWKQFKDNFLEFPKAIW